MQFVFLVEILICHKIVVTFINDKLLFTRNATRECEHLSSDGCKNSSSVYFEIFVGAIQSSVEYGFLVFFHEKRFFSTAFRSRAKRENR